MYSALTVLVTVLAISTAGPTTSSPQVCPKPPSAANASFADLTGDLQYLKYYAGSENMLYEFDGVAYQFVRQGDSNRYTVAIIKVTVNGTKKEEKMDWTEYPAENKLSLSIESETMIYYSIPYLEKNKSYVFYTCDTNINKMRKFALVLTPNLDSIPTKAIEEARKHAGSDLVELPYKFKNAFLASKTSQTIKD